MLLPQNLHMQLLESGRVDSNDGFSTMDQLAESAIINVADPESDGVAPPRNRTPSPDLRYAKTGGRVPPPPPRLLLAPPPSEVLFGWPPQTGNSVTQSREGRLVRISSGDSADPALFAVDGEQRYSSQGMCPQEQDRDLQSQGLQQSTSSRRGRRCLLQTAQHLGRLDSQDPEKVVIVRKINRLGFGADAALRQHFGRYGVVEEILLSGAPNKPASSSRPEANVRTRWRPAGFAFLVMESSEAACAALSGGTEQLINGVTVLVSEFRSRSGTTFIPEGGSTTGADSSTSFPEVLNMHRRPK